MARDRYTPSPDLAAFEEQLGDQRFGPDTRARLGEYLTDPRYASVVFNPRAIDPYAQEHNFSRATLGVRVDSSSPSQPHTVRGEFVLEYPNGHTSTIESNPFQVLAVTSESRGGLLRRRPAPSYKVFVVEPGRPRPITTEFSGIQAASPLEAAQRAPLLMATHRPRALGRALISEVFIRVNGRS